MLTDTQTNTQTEFLAPQGYFWADSIAVLALRAALQKKHAECESEHSGTTNANIRLATKEKVQAKM